MKLSIGNFFGSHVSRTACSQSGKSPAHHFGDAVGIIDHVAPLGDFLEVFGGDKTGGQQPPACLAAGQDQDRNGVAESLGHTGKSVFYTRTGLHCADSQALAEGGTGKAVGHPHADSFVPGHDRPDALFGPGFEDRILGKTADKLHPFHFEDFSDRSPALHVHNLPLITNYSNFNGKKRGCQGEGPHENSVNRYQELKTRSSGLAQ